MNALDYLINRFPKQVITPETELADLRGFGPDDLGGLIITIEMATDGRVVPTDAQAMAWVTVGDVLACERQKEAA